MNIHFVAPYWHPFTGGAEIAAYEMAKKLATVHDVQIHTSYYSAVDQTEMPGLTFDQNGGFWVRRYRSPKSLVSFWPDIREADIVHMNGFYRGLSAAVAFAPTRAKRILQPHGNISMVKAEPSSLSRSLRLFYDGTFAQYVINRYDRILCLKEEERLAMSFSNQINSAKYILFPEPLRAEYSNPLPEEDAPSRDSSLFISVSRIVPGKYIEHVIRALSLVPEAKLAIIGPLDHENYVTFLESEIARLGLRHRVRLVGSANSNDLRYWYHQANGVVISSASEGWPLVIAEAIVHGCVPIGTKEAIGNITDNIESIALYNWGDEIGLAKIISNLSKTMLAESPAMYRSQSWVRTNLQAEAVAKRLSAIYEDVTSEC